MLEDFLKGELQVITGKLPDVGVGIEALNCLAFSLALLRVVFESFGITKEEKRNYREWKTAKSEYLGNISKGLEQKLKNGNK